MVNSLFSVIIPFIDIYGHIKQPLRRVCVGERKLKHCGYCPDYPCDIFPAEPDAGNFTRKWKAEVWDWTTEDDKMMEPYNPKRFLDEWRKNNG